MTIEVIKPGLFSVFQDLGRRGYQRFGVPVNGAMDERAHRMANWLVGNSAAMATLEVTMLGPTLIFHATTTIAISGADLGANINSSSLPPGKSANVRPGDTLTFGRRAGGARAYLAVRGGYDLPPIMGSVSTNSRARFGGIDGQPLYKGDTIRLLRPSLVTGMKKQARPVYSQNILLCEDAPVRVMKGLEWGSFSTTSQKYLLADPYKITPQSDRMGYRLSGPELGVSVVQDMLSETVGFGTIQVPPDGQPIILMADRGTSGGYPRIAHVISVDLPRLAQMVPGQSLRFELIDLEAAQKLVLSQACTFTEMEKDC